LNEHYEVTIEVVASDLMLAVCHFSSACSDSWWPTKFLAGAHRLFCGKIPVVLEEIGALDQ
jgi:hypothetical protein